MTKYEKVSVSFLAKLKILWGRLVHIAIHNSCPIGRMQSKAYSQDSICHLLSLKLCEYWSAILMIKRNVLMDCGKIGGDTGKYIGYTHQLNSDCRR